MNICTNAAHSMEETGGILEVGLSVEHLLKDHDKDPAPFVKLTIRDTGCGIKKEYLDRIFDPYFTTKEFGKGSGMGLAIVHGIVEGHNGKISVISRPGTGTVFQVFFPKLTEKTTPVPEPMETMEKGFEKVLVVDDEKTMAKVTGEMLKRLGYNVTLRTSSVEALDLFAADPAYFDLVITDQTMPKMTGEQMSEKMMALRRDIPVILCTGYSSKIDKAKAERMGIKAFLMKPVSKTELAGTIRRVLDRHPLS
jgi:CheY-like chemotaxis protein/anti-sigma regulatory factor (Ser/Thr protein kinase)